MVIPKEKLTSFERWSFTSFDQKPPPPVVPVSLPTGEEEMLVAMEDAQPIIDEPPPPPPPPAPTAEELEQLRASIHAEAHSAGHEAGYAAGYAEGMAQAKADADAKLQEQTEQIHTLVNSLQASLGRLDQEIAEQLLDTALAIAKEVLRSQIAVKKEKLVPVVKEAIANLPLHHAHITLHLNPSDAKILRPLLAEHFAQTNTQIIDNTEISAGGCLVTAGSSEVDASIETRWQRVLEAIGKEPDAWQAP